jgi:hypothetical protein
MLEEARLSSARRAIPRPFKSFSNSRRSGAEKHTPMRPMLSDLKSFTPDQARAYLKAAKNDELAAAIALAHDRNVLDALADKGARRVAVAPDDTEVHHALFLLRRALGLPAPSFDSLRVALRQRAA